MKRNCVTMRQRLGYGSAWPQPLVRRTSIPHWSSFQTSRSCLARLMVSLSLSAAISCSVLGFTSTVAVAADAHPGCQVDQIPAFSLGFAGLRQQVGVAMGDPVECERTDPRTGSAFQRTTTGLALYRRDTNMPMFTNGQEHWALTAGGLTHWSGWHGDAVPTLHAATNEAEGTQQRAVPAGPYMRVDAVTLTDILDVDGRRFIVRRDDAAYMLEVEVPCVAERTPGDTIFIVSGDIFGGSGSRVLLDLDGRECLVTEGHSLSH